ncbi:hypothetical protein PVAP13_5KG287500 [Panicum virgatum]|uniref:Uncharacterized protein n=1 Tax=Panicum virgatum TaxID=38727 RepID=A0A8T0SLA7_PANVG|nr:hypothetical protein PVAP13_5KG287500 [Panicum virgatum]
MVEGESSGAISVDVDEIATLITEKIHYYSSIAEDGIHKSTISSCFIPKVTKNIRMLDRSAYEPCSLAIGPYHHGNPCLQTFQKKKWSCLSYILFLNRNVKLHDYLNKIAELESKVRNCYLDEMDMDSSEFLQMLLLDGCFILVHLRGLDGMPNYQGNRDENPEITVENNTTQLDRENTNNATSYEVNVDQYDVKHTSTSLGQLEPIGTSSNGKATDGMHANVSLDSEQGQITQEKDARWYVNYAYHDFLLLENQIPFFVIKTIYEVLVGAQDSNRLTDNIAIFIESIIYLYPKAIQETERPKDFHHLLHLCHMYLSPNQQQEQHHSVISPEYFQGILSFGRRYFKVSQHQEEKEKDLILQETSNSHCKGKLCRWRCAAQYHEAGIEFKRREQQEHRPHSLLDVRFHNGVLEVPFLFIDDVTGSRFRNLIALEKTSPHLGNGFTAYAAFIAQLISSPKDVTLLVKRGIIVHQMRSDEHVSVIFTGLLKNIDFDRNGLHYLRSTCIALEEHYQNRINRWMAWLWQNHFSNPWLSLAVLAAIIVLVCTILQLVFALLVYVNPAAENSSAN